MCDISSESSSFGGLLLLKYRYSAHWQFVTVTKTSESLQRNQNPAGRSTRGVEHSARVCAICFVLLVPNVVPSQTSPPEKPNPILLDVHSPSVYGNASPGRSPTRHREGIEGRTQAMENRANVETILDRPARIVLDASSGLTESVANDLLSFANNHIQM